MRSVEVDRGRAADQRRRSCSERPSAQPLGAIAERDDLLLGRGEHIGDVEVPGDLDVHAGRDVGLRVEVDDEGREAAREGRRRQSERHGGLADAALEGADAEYVHEQIRYLH